MLDIDLARIARLADLGEARKGGRASDGSRDWDLPGHPFAHRERTPSGPRELPQALPVAGDRPCRKCWVSTSNPSVGPWPRFTSERPRR